MQNPRAVGLSQHPSEKWGHGAAAATESAHRGQAAHLQAAGHEAGENGGGAGVDGTEEETDEGDRDGVADEVGHAPDEDLEGRGTDGEDGDGGLFANVVRGVGEEEAAACDAGPEARGDVAGVHRGGVSVSDEEGDHPAGDGDFGALVGEDEKGAEDGGFVAEGFEEERGFGARAALRVGEVGVLGGARFGRGRGFAGGRVGVGGGGGTGCRHARRCER